METDSFFKGEQDTSNKVDYSQLGTQIPQDQELPAGWFWQEGPDGKKYPMKDIQAGLQRAVDESLRTHSNKPFEFFASAPFGDPRGYIASLQKDGIDTGKVKISDDPSYNPLVDNGKARMEDMGVNVDPYAANDWISSGRAKAQAALSDAQMRNDPQANDITLGRSDDQTAQAANQKVASWMTAAELAPVNYTTASSANKVALDAADQQFRLQQSQLASQLGEAAAGRGPSLATAALGQGNAAGTAARMSAAAAERGYGNSAATRRGLLYAQGAQNNLTNIEAAKMRIAEQLAARAEWQNVLSGARGQDITRASTQASLDQGVNLQNAAQRTNVNLANQQAANQFAIQQGTFNQDTAARNQSTQHELDLNNLANQQSANMSNADWSRNASQTQAQLSQNTAQMNLEASLRARGMNDQQIAQMMGMQNSLGHIDQQNAIAYDQNRIAMEQWKLGTELGISQENYNRAQAAAAKKDSFWGTALGVGGAIVGGVTGGPGGAAAGGALGSGLGNAIDGGGGAQTSGWSDFGGLKDDKDGRTRVDGRIIRSSI